MKDIIINPDIHGRTFWKEGPLSEVKLDDVEKIIFLGDYLDPYAWEDITRKQAIDNFNEIMEFKKANMDKVVLLLGNHDIQYIDRGIGCSRLDTVNMKDIHNILISNKKLFQLGYTTEYKGRNISFTHAPILKSWLDAVNQYVKVLPDDIKEVIDELNKRWLSSDIYSLPILGGLLSFCSHFRGGYDATSSPIWADIREFKSTSIPSGWYQIFGHTQLVENPVITAYGADLDCRRAFKLSEVLDTINNNVQN